MRISDWSADVCSSDLLGQALPPRRSIDQPHAKAILQKADMLADHRSGQAKRVGGRGEGTQIRRFDEDGHAREAIHIRNLWLLIPYRTTDISPRPVMIPQIRNPIGSASCRERVCQNV